MFLWFNILPKEAPIVAIPPEPHIVVTTHVKIEQIPVTASIREFDSDETKSNGTVVFDGCFAPIGFLKKPVTLHVKKGRITRITGNRSLQAIFSKYGMRERVLCELGIGTNPSAKITGNVLEDEKRLGSIHLAFGNNLGFGGRNKARIHLDGVIKKPTIYIDETLIIKKGKFLL